MRRVKQKTENKKWKFKLMLFTGITVMAIGVWKWTATDNRFQKNTVDINIAINPEADYKNFLKNNEDVKKELEAMDINTFDQLRDLKSQNIQKKKIKKKSRKLEAIFNYHQAMVELAELLCTLMPVGENGNDGNSYMWPVNKIYAVKNYFVDWWYTGHDEEKGKDRDVKDEKNTIKVVLQLLKQLEENDIKSYKEVVEKQTSDLKVHKAEVQLIFKKLKRASSKYPPEMKNKVNNEPSIIIKFKEKDGQRNYEIKYSKNGRTVVKHGVAIYKSKKEAEKKMKMKKNKNKGKSGKEQTKKPVEKGKNKKTDEEKNPTKKFTKNKKQKDQKEEDDWEDDEEEEKPKKKSKKKTKVDNDQKEEKPKKKSKEIENEKDEVEDDDEEEDDEEEEEDDEEEEEETDNKEENGNEYENGNEHENGNEYENGNEEADRRQRRKR